jgi:hypothetical protein
MFVQLLFLYVLLCYFWSGYMIFFNAKTKKDFKIYNISFQEKFLMFVFSPILIVIEFLLRIFKPGVF